MRRLHSLHLAGSRCERDARTTSRKQGAAVSDAVPMIARCRRRQLPACEADIHGATVEIARTALRVQCDIMEDFTYPLLSLYEDRVVRWRLGPEGKWSSTRL